MLDICKAHGVKVIADEIHHDIVFAPHVHHCAATVGSYDEMLVTLMAPSKTFNLAGCQNAFAVIPDVELRQQFDALQKTLAMTGGSMFGYVAAEAAYRGGAEWFAEVKQAIWENFVFARDRLAEALPQVTFCKVDVDEERELALSAGIESIPTLLVIKNGRVEKRLVGYREKDALLREIEAVL